MFAKEGQKSLLEFLWGGADGAAVVGGADFPELGVGIARVDEAGVADWDVAVDLAVDEKDGGRRCGDGIFRRNLLHVEVVFQAGAEEGDFD